MTWVNPDWSTIVEWNAALEDKEERELVPRDYLWASELGKSPIDVILRMKGVAETNPPNGRSKRKFEAGNYMEWLVSLVYTRAGILKSKQQRIEHQYPGLLKVTGKSDFLVGGIPDYAEWERTEAMMRELNMPDFVFRTASAIRKGLAEKYPEGLAEKFIEVKSMSGRMFELMEKRAKEVNGKKVWTGMAGHRKQLFHYLKGANYPSGDILYVEKDSLLLSEVPVHNPGEVEAEYRQAIEVLTQYYETAKDMPVESFVKDYAIGQPSVFEWKEGLPHPEPLVVFSEDLGKFSKNFNVEYSSYLSLLYGFQQPADYDAAFQPLVGRWNRVLTRCKNGDKMTPKNLEVLDEIRNHNFDIEQILRDFAAEAEEGEE